MVQLKRLVQSVLEDVEQPESSYITDRSIGWYILEKYFFKRKLLFFFKKKYMRGIGLGKKRLLLTARSVIVFVGPCGRPIAREKELG